MDEKVPSHSKALQLFSRCPYLSSQYKFLDLLGQGGFSLVYLACSLKNPSKKVAIKFIPSKLNDFSEKCNEILIHSSLKYNEHSHSHIISVFETYIDPTEFFTLIVMENAERSLDDLLHDLRHSESQHSESSKLRHSSELRTSSESRNPEKRIPEKRIPEKRIPEKRIPEKRVPEKRNLDEKRIPEKRNFGLKFELFLQIFFDIFAGLQYAHSQQIVHGDLKPANILIFSIESREKLRNPQRCFVSDSQQIAKIADWGSGKVAGDMINMTRKWETSLFLTQSFAAPEALKNEDLSLNLTKIDIYSFGLCMLRCCGVKEKEFKYWNLLPTQEKFAEELKEIVKKYRICQIYGKKIGKLLRKMICFDYKERICIAGIYEALMEISAENSAEFACKHRFSRAFLAKRLEKGLKEEKSEFIAKCPEKDCDFVINGEKMEEIIGETRVFNEIYRECQGCKLMKMKVFIRKLTNCEKRHRVCYKCLKKATHCPKRSCGKKIAKNDFFVICQKCEKNVRIEEMMEFACCERFYCEECVKNMRKKQGKFKKNEFSCEKCENSVEKCEICEIFMVKKSFEDLGCEHRVCDGCLGKFINKKKNSEKHRIRCPLEKCGNYLSIGLVKKYRAEKNEENEENEVNLDETVPNMFPEKKTRKIEKNEKTEKIGKNEKNEKNRKKTEKIEEEKTLEKAGKMRKIEKIRKNSKNSNICQKCLKSPEHHNLSTKDFQCSHTFCDDCIKKELLLRLSSNPDEIGPEVLRCLSQNCSFIIEIRELQIFISDDLIQKLRVLKLRKKPFFAEKVKSLEKFNKNCLICNKNLVHTEKIALLCGHNFCKKCLVPTWEVKLHDPLFEPLKCPLESCKGPINFFTIKANLPENLFRIFEGRFFATILYKRADNFAKNEKASVKCPKCAKPIQRSFTVKYLICDSEKCQKKTVFCVRCRSILPLEVTSLLNFPGSLCTKCLLDKKKKVMRRNRLRKQGNLQRKNEGEIKIIKPFFLK